MASIGGYAFSGCPNLISVTIPSSVTNIGEYAFHGSKSMKILTIGEKVSSIGSHAFAYCEELTNVYCLAENVPTTNANAFDESYIEYCTLHVSEASVNDYRAATPWKNFGTFKTTEGGSVEVQKCEMPTIAFENGELVCTSATEGADITSEVTVPDMKKSYDSRVTLTATYNITAYAMKNGYENSDVATATLVWVADGNTTENDKIKVTAMPVLINSANGQLILSGLQANAAVTAYTTAGTEIATATASAGTATIDASADKGSVVVVKIGSQSVKVMVK